jgi:hypothetical protein
MRTRFLFLVLTFSLLFSFSACSKAQSLPEEESEQVFEYANPIAENLLTGLNDGDYETFSKDFNEDMKAAIDEAAFLQMKENFDEKLGAYEFLQQDTVVKDDDGYVAAFYVVEFEKAPAVTMRLVFTDGDDTHKATGLWFDAPELR